MSISMLSSAFVEAKQALSIAGPICTEANTLISTSRRQIEQAAVLWAQTVFMNRAVKQQFEILQRIRDSLMGLQESSYREFETSLHQFEAMDKRLNASLTALNTTILDPAFSKKTRSLKSFVYEEGIGQLRSSVDTISSHAKDSEQKLIANVSRLDADMALLHGKMISLKHLKKQALEHAHDCTESIASDARGMAMLLESLTHHYDLCLKAQELSSQTDSSSVQELDEILPILENDSKEVEEVIEELYGRRKGIEEAEAAVAQFHTEMGTAHAAATDFFEEFDQFGKTQLLHYSKELAVFSKEQQGYSIELSRLMKEMESLANYYEVFLKSYHAMVLEILRRKRAQQSINSMVNKMSQTLTEAYQAEVDARQRFISERGDYLPSDLWDGLTETLPEPHIVIGNSTLPDLTESTIGRAIREF